MLLERCPSPTTPNYFGSTRRLTIVIEKESEETAPQNNGSVSPVSLSSAIQIINRLAHLKTLLLSFPDSSLPPPGLIEALTNLRQVTRAELTFTSIPLDQLFQLFRSWSYLKRITIGGLVSRSLLTPVPAGANAVEEPNEEPNDAPEDNVNEDNPVDAANEPDDTLPDLEPEFDSEFEGNDEDHFIAGEGIVFVPAVMDWFAAGLAHPTVITPTNNLGFGTTLGETSEDEESVAEWDLVTNQWNLQTIAAPTFDAEEANVMENGQAEAELETINAPIAPEPIELIPHELAVFDEAHVDAPLHLGLYELSLLKPNLTEDDFVRLFRPCIQTLRSFRIKSGRNISRRALYTALSYIGTGLTSLEIRDLVFEREDAPLASFFDRIASICPFLCELQLCCDSICTSDILKPLFTRIPLRHLELNCRSPQFEPRQFMSLFENIPAGRLESLYFGPNIRWHPEEVQILRDMCTKDSVLFSRTEPPPPTVRERRHLAIGIAPVPPGNFLLVA